MPFAIKVNGTVRTVDVGGDTLCSGCCATNSA
jgi:hypothetical protein